MRTSDADDVGAQRLGGDLAEPAHVDRGRFAGEHELVISVRPMPSRRAASTRLRADRLRAWLLDDLDALAGDERSRRPVVADGPRVGFRS